MFTGSQRNCCLAGVVFAAMAGLSPVAAARELAPVHVSCS